MSTHEDGQTTGVVTATEEGVQKVETAAPTVVDRGVGERAAAPEPAPEAASPGEGALAPSAPQAPEEDFEALLAEAGEGAGVEATTQRTQAFVPGETAKGVVEVISLMGQEVFLDLGGRATGYIMKEELLDAEGELTVTPGDVVEGTVVRTDAHGVLIRRVVGGAGADLTAIREAHAAGLPVEGKVVGLNKGGFDVSLAGLRAFCPMGQIDLFRSEEPAQYLGQVHRFKVLEVKDRGGVVLSRLALLKEERAKRAEAMRASVTPGARLQGTVSSIQKFGVFVDLGGLDGLVHVSEMSWSRVDDPSKAVRLGQPVDVVVLEVDTKKDRIALSMKQASEDPYTANVSGLAVGDAVDGTVARLTQFGAFVTLFEHVDGLIHISDLAHYRVRHPKDVLAVGDSVRVKVTEIDLARRRVGLSLKALAEDPWDGVESRYSVGKTVTGKVAKIAEFGVFVDLEPGVTALLPASESGVPHGKPLASGFKVGSEVEANVLRVEPDARRMALSKRDPSEARPPRDDRRGGGGDRRGPRSDGPRRGRGRRDDGPRTWRDSEDKPDAGLGSFGALLQKALDPDAKK